MAPAFRPGRRKSHCKPYPAGHFKKKTPSEDLRDGGCSTQAMPSNLEEESTVAHVVAGYSTPKTKKSRIPEQLSCPPAPKKRKIAAANNNNLHPNTSPSISFFTSPDLDLFFLYALHEII